MAAATGTQSPPTRAARVSPARVVVVLTAGVVLGALLGFAVSLLLGSAYRATALVDAGPGVTVADQLDVASDRADRFVQTELVYIGILAPKMADAAVKAGVATPGSVSAQQVGATNVVQISATGTTPEQAARTAEAAANVYIDDWRVRTSASARRGIENLDAQITPLQTQVDGIPTSGATPDQKAQRDALQARLDELRSQRSTLAAQVQSVTDADRLIEAASAANAVSTSSTVRLVALGAIAGLAVSVAVLVVTGRRRRSPAADEAWLE